MLGPFDLLLPPTILICSALTLPFTVISLLASGRTGDLLNWGKLKHTWFRHLWGWFGPASKPLFAPDVRRLYDQARGTVLDIGPGSGIWMNELGVAARAGKIDKIYGVEPNVNFQKPLLAAAKQAGLQNIYQPVPAYVENLDKFGIEKGSVDTIITVHVLCSVGPQLEQITHDLYQYLKPGGQWLVYEHVGSGRTLARSWQRIVNVVWPHLLDGCDLTRNTQSILKKAGDWEIVSLNMDPKDGYFEALPHCVGRLQKST
ncbi:S-adenosyl-L-methionine-dependent methyltransferase [Myriangium duriaei CBS 260.36]|uniref:S-adenosyl-L-methionine-dependent methyltransferase n=1 Tax=Myriangium duriaei CBS 260.36 TaxID=1168546 RepID=A0A9P4J185_9PEZI|nr:S-adenosyl-L-methionine-dependent methyltransferase [Myriangium duriaei CBS 260.36]